MKVSSNIAVIGFVPIILHLTIESEEEARAIYAIFNYAGNTDLFKYGQDEEVREELKDFSTTGPNNVISNGIIYRKFYRPKKL